MNEARQAYAEILESIIPECIEHFRGKTQDYSGGPAFQLLGLKGQFADINRKFWKLYQFMWLGEEPKGESIEEILKDFFGHVMLSLYCVRNQNSGEWTNDFEGVATKLDRIVSIMMHRNDESPDLYRQINAVLNDED